MKYTGMCPEEPKGFPDLFSRGTDVVANIAMVVVVILVSPVLVPILLLGWIHRELFGGP